MMHSPFEVQEDFISPLQCEKLIDALALKRPDFSEDGQPLKYERLVPPEHAGNVLSSLNGMAPLIENRYEANVQNTNLVFQQYWENSRTPAEAMGCEAYKFVRQKWTKIKDIHLVGFIWLKDFNTAVPLDPRFEVYGGKLEFPAYNFSLTPVRGTLVIFPATPHFVTAVSHVLFGSLEVLKVNIKLSTGNGNWDYNAAKYPGTYQEWFLSAKE